MWKIRDSVARQKNSERELDSVHENFRVTNHKDLKIRKVK